METDNLFPEGFSCRHCGRYAKFSPGAMAQFRITPELMHTCECGARARLFQGRPVFFIPPPAFHTATGPRLDAYGARYGVSGRAPQESDDAYRNRIFLTFRKVKI